MAKELTILHRCGEVITRKRVCVNQLNLTPEIEKEIKQRKRILNPRTYEKVQIR